jgi:arabinofuranan 3-O-arabinosyltransferase
MLDDQRCLGAGLWRTTVRMIEPVQSACTGKEADRKFPRVLGIFAAWRLGAYGGALAIVYAGVLVNIYRSGVWLVNSEGVPVYTDFTCAWVAGLLALHGQIASLYDPVEFVRVQATFAVTKLAFYQTWPYPPIFFLILAPLAMLTYVAAFLAWNLVTLIGCIAAVYVIVPRLATIALVLASPFTFWNFIAGQNGFLTASLLGAALLFLERQPVLAGVFIGCLTYKPHMGILLPLALVVSRRWRAIASAAVTAALLASASIAAFGTEPWQAFPEGFADHTEGIILSDPKTDPGYWGTDPTGYWGHLQTVYGLVRYLDGGTALAWLAQGITTVLLAVIVWLLWRSSARYPLKAAALSAAALIATPYAFAYDMAAIAVPMAFLASDQMRGKLLRGEQTMMLALFGVSLSVIPTLGKVPIAPLIILSLLGLIVRRALHQRRSRNSVRFSENFFETTPSPID